MSLFRAFHIHRSSLLIFGIISIFFLQHCKQRDRAETAHNAAIAQLFVLSIVEPFRNDGVVDYSDRTKPGRGRLLTSQKKWTIPLDYIQIFVDTFLDLADKKAEDFPQFKPLYGVEYHAITYETIDENGKKVIASGAVWLAKGSSDSAMVFFGHGTHMDTQVDSISGPRGYGLLYSTRGYVTAIADYTGYGASEARPHNYLHGDTLASSSIDMIRATQSFSSFQDVSLRNELFLTGVSEGGLAALATLKEIETGSTYGDLPALVAAAPISGPYDMSWTTDYYLASDRIYTSRAQPGYIGFVIPAYNRIYNLDRSLSYYFQEPYASQLENDPFPRRDYIEIIRDIPLSAAELFNSAFLESYNNGLETELETAIANNITYNFGPTTPVRLYASDGDTQVPAANTRTAETELNSNGATATDAVILPATAGDHVESAIELVALSLDWFASF